MAPPDSIWHKESLKLKEIFGTREGFEICPNNFSPRPNFSPPCTTLKGVRCRASACSRPRVGACASRPRLPNGRAQARGRLSGGGRGTTTTPPPTKENQWERHGASACGRPKGGVQAHNGVALAS